MWFWRRSFFSFSVLTISFGLGLDSDSNLFGLGLVLDSTKVDLTTALTDIPRRDLEAHGCTIHPRQSPHVARICTQFLEAENIPVLAWPAYSPDMSPIKHVWDALDRRTQLRVPVPANIQQLRIEEEWTNIPQAQIRRQTQIHRRAFYFFRGARMRSTIINYELNWQKNEEELTYHSTDAIQQRSC